MPDVGRHGRVYRALLVVYPASFRTEYAEPMTQLVVDRLRHDGGGPRTALVWIQVLADLAKTALSEHMEMTMTAWKTGWWRILAVPLGMFLVFAGIGNALEPETTAGPDWRTGAALYAVATILGLVLVIAGLVVRKRSRKWGSTMIAVGVMPGFPLTIMMWYPPVALVGALSIAISMSAFIDAPKAPQTVAEPIS